MRRLSNKGNLFQHLKNLYLDGFQKYVSYEQIFMAQLAAKQNVADKAAWDYNHKGGITPAQRAVKKAIRELK